MKRTQKRQLEILKESKGLFAVYAFENGVRKSGYIGVGLLDAFQEMLAVTAKGLQVVVTKAEHDKEFLHWEIDNKKRVPYEMVLKYAVSYDMITDSFTKELNK